MKRYLLIAEKPSLMRAIQDAYNSLPQKPFIADLVSLHGHFVGPCEPDYYRTEWGKPWNKDVLPMIPEKFVYKILPGCEADYKKIRYAIRNVSYDGIVNCCDAGREGEAIFWNLIYSISGVPNVEYLRLWAQDVTEETLSNALLNLIPYNKSDDLVRLRESSILRAQFDWLVGMNLSRAAMLTTRLRASVGRVKTPTMNLVVQRDKEIKNFVSKDFFEVEAEFGGAYRGSWFDPDTKQTSFDTREQAKAFISSLGNIGTVESVNSEQVTFYAPALYSLAELQKEANSFYGFTAGKTLKVAQSLYETHKILSYPRTESRVLSAALARGIPTLLKTISEVPEVADQVKLILSEPERIKRVCNSKKYVDNKKVTDHHAIINTTNKPDLSKLTSDERKLYILVLKKFVSIFLDPYVVKKTVIITDVDGKKFKTNGSVVEAIGYRILYKGDKGNKDDNNVLPPVAAGEKKPVTEIKVVAKKTKPPEPYNDRTLIDAMQHAGKFVDDSKMKDLLDDVKGIGTSATRSVIIDDLVKKGFIRREGKTIRANELAISASAILAGKNILSPSMTAEWEGRLRSIEEGEIGSAEFSTLMEDYIKSETAAFLSINLDDIANAKKEASKDIYGFEGGIVEIGACPLCGDTAFMSKKYIYCKNRKDPQKNCMFIIARDVCGGLIRTEDAKRLCAGETTDRLIFKSKSNRPFNARLRYSPAEKKCEFIFDDSD